eukprot:scaffold134313_cov22-Tisochrysis_lutea.AAC.1
MAWASKYFCQCFGALVTYNILCSHRDAWPTTNSAHAGATCVREPLTPACLLGHAHYCARTGQPTGHGLVPPSSFLAPSGQPTSHVLAPARQLPGCQWRPVRWLRSNAGGPEAAASDASGKGVGKSLRLLPAMQV